MTWTVLFWVGGQQQASEAAAGGRRRTGWGRAGDDGGLVFSQSWQREGLRKLGQGPLTASGVDLGGFALEARSHGTDGGCGRAGQGSACAGRRPGLAHSGE